MVGHHYFCLKLNPNFCFKLRSLLPHVPTAFVSTEMRREPSPFFRPLCVCNFFHFHRIFRFGSNRHHSPLHVALRSRLLPPLVVDIFALSDQFLGRSSLAVQGDYMAR